MNTQLINGRRFRFLVDEDYQPIYTFGSTNGSIDYKHIPWRSPYLRPSSKGLSAGVIVAIILCTLVVVAAIGFVLYFLIRRASSKLKAHDIISANSTSNINK